jgi:prefoldin subunit 5
VEVRRLQQEQVQLKSRLAELDKLRDKLAIEHKELARQCDSLERERDDLQAKHDALEESSKELTRESDSLGKDVTKLKADVERLESLRKEYLAQIADRVEPASSPPPLSRVGGGGLGGSLVGRSLCGRGGERSGAATAPPRRCVLSSLWPSCRGSRAAGPAAPPAGGDVPVRSLCPTAAPEGRKSGRKWNHKQAADGDEEDPEGSDT